MQKEVQIPFTVCRWCEQGLVRNPLDTCLYCCGRGTDEVATLVRGTRMEGNFVYDQDPTGSQLTIGPLNSAYVMLTVTDEDDRTATLLITPQALRDAAAAAEEMTS